VNLFRRVPAVTGLVGCLVLAAALPLRAAADEEDPLAEAGRRFDQGVAYVNEGRFEAAMAEFLRAYDISGEWTVLYNLGQVSRSLGRNADAYDYFRRYLAAGGDDVEADRRSEVEQALVQLEPRVARLAVEVDLDGALVLVDGAERGVTPLSDPVVVDPGSHVVEIRDERLAGGRERREVILAGGLTETVRVSAPSPGLPPPVNPPPPSGTAEEGSVWTSWWLWTIVGAVVAGGAVTAGVLLWPEESTTYTEGNLPPIVLGTGAP